MALLKNFTDSSGNEHTPAYWRMADINIDAVGQHIKVVFLGYKSLAAFQAGKQPLPGAQKVYVIEGSEFQQVAFQAAVGATPYHVLANASESYALAKLDVDSGETSISQIPTLDGHGQQVYGAPVPVLDGEGNPTYDQIPVLDEEGQPVLDAEGNPTYDQQQVFAQGEPLMTDIVTPVMVSFFHDAEQS